MKSMLAKYKWWILGALLLAVGAIAYFQYKKKKDASAAAAAASKQAPVTEEIEQGLVSNEAIRRQVLANDIAGALN